MRKIIMCDIYKKIMDIVRNLAKNTKNLIRNVDGNYVEPFNTYYYL